MAGQNPHLETSFWRLLSGERWSITRRALVLSSGFFSVVGAANIVALTFKPSIGESNVGTFWWEMMNYSFGFTTFSPSVDLVGAGAFLVSGLALVHGYLNKGYVPSLVLATAPMYANFVSTIDGPVGLVLPIHGNLVVAPFWAASHVLPNSVAYGTLGFLLGLGLQYFQRQYTARFNQDTVRPA